MVVVVGLERVKGEGEGKDGRGEEEAKIGARTKDKRVRRWSILREGGRRGICYERIWAVGLVLFSF